MAVSTGRSTSQGLPGPPVASPKCSLLLIEMQGAELRKRKGPRQRAGGEGEGRAMCLTGVIIYKRNIWPMQLPSVAGAKACFPMGLVKLWPGYIYAGMQELFQLGTWKSQGQRLWNQGQITCSCGGSRNKVSPVPWLLLSWLIKIILKSN